MRRIDRSVPCALGLVCVVALAGCGAHATAPAQRHRAREHPAPTPTISVAFAVAVTPRPTPGTGPTPLPTAAKFVVPPGPYLRLAPNAGPPVSKSISVIGGHLPSNALVSLVWSFGSHLSSLGTTTQTDGRGELLALFQVPATAPGKYRLSAYVSGKKYAGATYAVRSTASLIAFSVPNSEGDRVSVHGAGFVPRQRVLLVAYSTIGAHRPITLGTTKSSDRGNISFRITTRALLPGTYLLRAWKTHSIVALLGSTYFQVAA